MSAQSPRNQSGLIRRTVRNPDDTEQSWAVGPPSAAVAFDPANGFPWNTPDEAYQPQCWPDPTNAIANALGNVLNVVSMQGTNVPDEGAYAPNADESVQAWAVQPPLNVVSLSAFTQPDDGQYQPTQDDTAPALTLGPPAETTTPQNAPDAATFAATATFSVTDDTAQPYAIQPPVVATFDPATGFPWNQDQGERFVQSQIVDDVIAWALGQPPLNAVSAQAFNVPDEGQYQTSTDDTSQTYPIQPPSVAAFDPAGGFPWPVDDVEIRWPVYVDDTSQPWAIGNPANAVALLTTNTPDDGTYAPTLDDTSPAWAVGPPAEVRIPWNTADEGGYQTNPDESVQPWAIVPPFDPASGFPWNAYGLEPALPAYVMDADSAWGGTWFAALPATTVTGGFPPGIYAAGHLVGGSAAGAIPGISSAGPVPSLTADPPTPGGVASNLKPSGS